MIILLLEFSKPMVSVSWGTAFLSILSGISVALLSGYISRVRDEKSWVSNEVYAEIYTEIDLASEGILPQTREGRFTSSWFNLSRYHRGRVDPKLRKKLEEYAHHLEALNREQLKIVDQEELVEELPSGMVNERENGSFSFNKMMPWDKSMGGETSFDKWIHTFDDAIFSADSPDEMATNMLITAEGRQAEAIQGWDEHISGWREAAYDAFHGEYGFTGEQEEYLTMKQEEIPGMAVRIQEEIDKRADAGILKTIYFRLNWYLRYRGTYDPRNVELKNFPSTGEN